ncbi:SDR family oxidoreductase [Fluviicola sp.]|uniref:SDR family oxidoreductase n=1 Tax=Fluviicola sp. TaxID=1917219 RepID=UPI0031D04CE6
MKKTVLITGASSGFGKESAKLFHQKGWNVIATMRSPEKETELTALEDVLVVKLDVQDQESIQQAVIAGVERFGTIHALVNSAGYGAMGVFEAATREQIQNQYEVNVFGTMMVTQAVLPVMRKNGKGSIVNISTFGGAVGMPFATLYSSSKFAVEGFSEALSHEVSELNIQVKIVEPGSVKTNFRNGQQFIHSDIEEYNTIMGNIYTKFGASTAHLVQATPGEVADVIYEAATDESTRLRYIIGADAQFYIDTKWKNTEDQFVRTIRSFFFG